MSRDYKTPVRTAKENKGNPFVTGIIIGILLGLLLAAGTALLFTDLLKPFGKKKAAEAVPAAAAAAAPDKKPATSTQDKTTFDFYRILPSNGNNPAAAANAAATNGPATDAATKPATPVPLPTQTAHAPAVHYYLQAGSFRKESEADNLKANLALMGVEAKIQSVTMPDNTMWHRVRLGPYADIEQANQAKIGLAQNGVNATVIKEQEATDQ